MKSRLTSLTPKGHRSLNIDKYERMIEDSTKLHNRAFFRLQELVYTPSIGRREKKAVEDLIEIMRFSDPCSAGNSNYYEELILDKIDSIKNNGSITMMDIQSLKELIGLRNIEIKSQK